MSSVGWTPEDTFRGRLIVPDGRQPRKRPVTNVDRFGHLKNEAGLKILDMAKMLYEAGKVQMPW